MLLRRVAGHWVDVQPRPAAGRCCGCAGISYLEGWGDRLKFAAAQDLYGARIVGP